MKDKYIENLVLTNPKYLDKYKNDNTFREAVNNYADDGCAEVVIKLLYKLTE